MSGKSNLDRIIFFTFANHTLQGHGKLNHCKRKLSALPFILFAGMATASSEPKPGEEVISAVLAMGVAPPSVAPARGDESAGPFRRLVIKGATVVDGTGAPPMGPVTIVVEGDRIVELKGGGTGSLHPREAEYGADTHVIDAAGKYVLPGFVDAHVHFGTPTHSFGGYLTNPEYVGKLLLAHGITTVREVGSIMGLEWVLEHKKLSDAGEISAPRIKAYAMFPEIMASPEAAREWVRSIHKTGADGVKFVGAAPELIEAAIGEAKKLGMGTAYHHSQISVTSINVLDSARMGLDSMEHWYGLPEAMFEDQRVQDYPYDYNYSNEQDRFSEAGRLWAQTAGPGSENWIATRDELLRLDFTLVPTFSIYEANRDLMRARTKEWHDEFTMPYMTRAFEPNPNIHGSYHFDWTTADEIAWKDNYRRWMSFVNDYKNAGGRVAAGADSGFIYGVYGFGYIRELEMLQEAGFHPLEVLQSATINGAELLGLRDEIGSIQVGKRADLIIVDENPMANLKVLYGTGHYKFDSVSGHMGRTNGIRYTIKDGIVFDAKMLLEDVRNLVQEQKEMEMQGAATSRMADP